MRAGGCTVQQSLTPEAASIVKQAVTLARRRGHAQVTPLHVANTMLSSSTGLLRTACLQSHSHPLQCKALELCFNVALNRLPASTSSPILSSHHSHQFPSISNALVAAFKRAQAHQRRGSIENQQQPLLAVKIELEQLIISILDDPSVSRVMREAGFSSTQVKSNVEQVVSLEICSQNSPNSVISKPNVTNCLDQIRNEDVICVLDHLMNRRKNGLVIVGECVDSIEGVIKGVMEKISKGDVCESLREVKFIQFSLSSFGQLSRVEVDQKIEDVKRVVRSYLSKGVVLNLGDLKWVVEYREQRGSNNNYLCPIEHMIMELGKLSCGIGESHGKFWLLGISTFQTYIKCKSGHPSLENVWELHPITIPAGSLRLSLITDSDTVSTSNKVNQNGWIILEGEEEDDEQNQLNCCVECRAKFEVEARNLQTSTSNSDSTTSTLPAWLRQYKNENNLANNNQASPSIKDLCRKWNSYCNSTHQLQPYSSEKNITFSSISPSSSTSCFSYDPQYPNLHQTPKLNSFRDQNFLNIGAENPNKGLRIYIPEHRDHTPRPPFSTNFDSNPNSTSSSDVMEMEYHHKFKEMNAENLKILCNELERKVPWQKDVISDIASTILQCRSGMMKRKGKLRNSMDVKEETWLLFQGVDMEAKEKIAKELAKIIFRSPKSFMSIALSTFSSTRADSTDQDCRNKRSRDEHNCSYIDRFSDAVSMNPHRVFFVEDVEQADYCSQIGFKRAIERGRVSNSNGDEVGLDDAIIILSCESFSSRSRACSPSIRRKSEENLGGNQEEICCSTMEETSPSVSLDLNISIDDDFGDDDQSIDDIGLLESVDKRIIFKFQEL
ncbi:Double Clp-N motif-containing P-loop nucleoside triphosphate hydrolases superfamily protein [Euphorbia peplus]|nr:Double Clp-N motif-containing P-loop nucleoside triphosphate hydrolases superfamily protein [Euphorbia peplus]